MYERLTRWRGLYAAGRALLFLAPSERGPMLEQLESAGVPVKPIRQNPAKVQHVGPALQALCSKNAELKVRFTCRSSHTPLEL